MKKGHSSIGRVRILPLAAFAAALTFSMPSMVRADPPGASASPGGSVGLRNEEQRRKEQQKEYIREHSGPSGKVNPKDYVKGIEHVRQMKVAPYIGAKPLGESSSSSTSTKTK